MAASGAGTDDKSTGGGGDAAQEREAMQNMNSGAAEVEIDEEKVMGELQELLKDVNATEAERYILEKALKNIKVSDADVETVATEFEISKPIARRKIREAGGKASEAMLRLMGVAEDDKGKAVLDRMYRRLKRLQELMQEAKEKGLDEAAAMAEASRLLAEEDKAASSQ